MKGLSTRKNQILLRDTIKVYQGKLDTLADDYSSKERSYLKHSFKELLKELR